MGSVKRQLVRRVGAVLAVASLGIAGANAVQETAPGDQPLRVRPASQPLLDHAQNLIEKNHSRVQRLLGLVAKGEDLRGRSDSMRRELIELYRAVHAIELAGDELLLRGERDGLLLRNRVEALTKPIDETVATLRPYLGSPNGLVNAATRRAKEQLSALKQLDELIKQRKWSAAHAKLEDLLEAADEVGRFPQPADVELLFKPIHERAAIVRTGYLIERKNEVIPELRTEFDGLRPNLVSLDKQLSDVAKAARDSKQLLWDNQPIDGPALVGRLAAIWPAIDQSVLQAVAVLHAIGPTAETDLRSLQSDYEAARIEANILLRELILADARTADDKTAAERYSVYLTAIPGFMTALHLAPDDVLSSTSALNELLEKSESLDSQVRAYRSATSEAMRWRRRVAQRYQRKVVGKTGPASIVNLIDQPPPRPGETTGAPVLPGQPTPAAAQRTTTAHWSINQTPEQLASFWTDQWKGTQARMQPTTVQWQSTEPTLVSDWHGRTVSESGIPRQKLLDCINRLSLDLLLGTDRPPITIESALAMHTAAFGPYRELAGRIATVTADHLPDRLFDQRLPTDLTGSLARETLVAYPHMPALVRLHYEPEWLFHDLFAESVAASSGDTGTPAEPPQVNQPLAETTGRSEARKPSDELPAAPPGQPAARVAEPVPAEPPAAGQAGGKNQSPAAEQPPVKKEPTVKPPGGGFRF